MQKGKTARRQLGSQPSDSSVEEGVTAQHRDSTATAAAVSTATAGSNPEPSAVQTRRRRFLTKATAVPLLVSTLESRVEFPLVAPSNSVLESPRENRRGDDIATAVVSRGTPV